MMFYDIHAMQDPPWRCFHCLFTAFHRLEDARNRMEHRSTAGVQSQCTFRRQDQTPRFRADVQGFRRGGEVDRYPATEFADIIDGVLLNRRYQQN